MPLIIHPESSCDVCLESLTYDDPTPPYAIPCGHIFCRACLRRTDPHNCPLCRKPYAPDRAKKLITGERAAPNGSGEDDDLLRRLVVSWDIQEEQLVTLLTEVDAWLQSRPENTSLPLRKARQALSSYQKLTTQTSDDQRTIRHLKHRLRRHEHAASLDKDTAVAVEQSLLAQVEELHTKVSQYESEIETLRKQLSTFKYTKNPLPPPPEPFPLDRLPAFAQPSVPGAHIYQWYPPAESSSTTYPQNGNGHVNPYDAASIRPRTPSNEPAPRSHHHPREPEGARSRDRKGKQKAREDRNRRHDAHRSPTTAPRGLPVNEADNTGANTSFNGNRNAIIPGATPNRRVVPNSVFDKPDLELYNGYESPVDPRDMRPVGLDLHFDRDPTRPIDPFTLTAEMMQEYANGYGSGYQDATDLQAPRTHGSTGPANGSAHPYSTDPPEGRDGHTSRRPPPSWLTDPPAVPAALHPGHASAHPPSSSRGVPSDEAPRAVPQWAPSQTDMHPAHHTVPPPSGPFPSAPATFTARPVLQEDLGNPTSTFQSLPPPPFINHGYDSDSRQRTIPDSLRPRNPRRSTVQIDGNLTDVSSFEYSSARAPALHRRPAARPAATLNIMPTTAPTPTIRPGVESRSTINTARDSTASWGTVESNGTPSVSRTVQSVTDLPLATFEDGAGVRGSMHSDSSMISFSRGNPFQNHSNAEGENIDRSHDNLTPRNRAASVSESVSTVRPDSGIPQPTERPRDRRMPSYPASPSHVQGSRYTQATTLSSGQPPDPTHAPTHRARRSSRHHHATTRISPVPVEDITQRSRPGTTADTAWSDTGYFTDAPLSSSDNALGLQISHAPQITAPTPVVSSRAFLRSFSHDYSRDYV